MHAMVSTSDIFLTDDGSADFKVHVKMPVEASVDFKNSWDPKDDSSKDKFFKNLQASFAQGGKITDEDVKGLETRYGPVEFDFKYGAEHVYQMANDMVLLREEQQGGMPDFSEDKRRYPVFLPTNSMVINHNTYHIPDGLKINFVPQDFSLKTDFMEASVKYTRGEGTIRVDSIYHLKRVHIPKHSFAQLKAIREALDKKDDLYIILKKNSNITQEAQTWLQKQ